MTDQAALDWWAQHKPGMDPPSSWGLSYLEQRSSPDNGRRFKRMRAGVITAARLMNEQFDGEQWRSWFCTLTYRPGVVWKAEHIRTFCDRLRKWAARVGCGVGYVWKMELGEEKGRLHYHVVVICSGFPWLPFLDQDAYDDQGKLQPAMWPHGMSQVKVARNPVGYMAKYIGKEFAGRIPRGARLWGFGGLDGERRGELRWWRSPRWLRRLVPLECGIKRLKGGWWANVATRWCFKSPYIWDVDECRTLWRGWGPGEVDLSGVVFETNGEIQFEVSICG